MQVAIVYADDPRAGFHCAVIQLGRRVHLDQRLHAQLPAERQQGGQGFGVERGNDQQKSVGGRRTRLPNLPRFDDKILAQNRE